MDSATPIGAIPAQLELALAELGPVPEAATIKLYNASNFFDPRAVPRQDWQAIAARVQSFGRVTVECHPRLVDQSCVDFGRILDPGLEIAMGLETVHPGGLSRLNKHMSLEDFERASSLIAKNGMDLRVFVLVGAPFIPQSEALDWVEKTVEFAFDSGARLVSLIPVRGGNGELERLANEDLFRPPTLKLFEAAIDRAVGLKRGLVQADLWEIDQLASCTECAPSRVRRLETINRSGEVEDSVACRSC